MEDFNVAIKSGDLNTVKNLFKPLPYNDKFNFIFQIDYKVTNEEVRKYLRYFLIFSEKYICDDHEEKVKEFLAKGYLDYTYEYR